MYILKVNVIFEAYLCEPPSSVHCFRDVTLYTSCFMKKYVLLECKRNEKDLYYKWLKNYGAYDFIDDIVSINREKGYRVGKQKANLRIDKINAHNLSYIINNLNILNQ